MSEIDSPEVNERGFVPGLALSRAFFDEIIEPAVSRALPRLHYAAGLFGAGSDALGYDTFRSMDHDWGPRCIIVLDSADEHSIGSLVEREIRNALPETFQGFPTLFQEAPGDPGVLVPADRARAAPLHHRVEVTTLDAIGEKYGYVEGDEDDLAFWLTISDQRLLELTSGAVFRDDHGDLGALRTSLAFYPDMIWRYRMSALWMRISQIEPFVGRTGEVDDETGSFVIAARIIEDFMRIALSQARQYAPYGKWLGSAFARLDISHRIQPHLDAVRHARDWHEREAGICGAASELVRAHNELGLTPEFDPAPRQFHSRPYWVSCAEGIAHALGATLRETPLDALPAGLGGIDQFMDSIDALNCGWLRQSVRGAISGQIGAESS